MITHINSSKSLRRLPGTLCYANTGGVHELNCRQVVSHKFGHRTGSIQEVIEYEQTGRNEFMNGQGAVGCGRHEPECSFGTNQKMLQNINRCAVIQQRVHAVAHGVLHGVLLADARNRLRVFDHTLAQAQQTLVNLGFKGAQAVIGIGRRSINNGSAGEYEHHRFQRVVGVEFGAGRHARGVIGDHPADSACRP